MDEDLPTDWQTRRVALKARDVALDAGREHVRADGPMDEAAIEAEAVQACREANRRRHRDVVDLVRSAPDVPPGPGDDLPE